MTAVHTRAGLACPAECSFHCAGDQAEQHIVQRLMAACNPWRALTVAHTPLKDLFAACSPARGPSEVGLACPGMIGVGDQMHTPVEGRSPAEGYCSHWRTAVVPGVAGLPAISVDQKGWKFVKQSTDERVGVVPLLMMYLLAQSRDSVHVSITASDACTCHGTQASVLSATASAHREEVHRNHPHKHCMKTRRACTVPCMVTGHLWLAIRCCLVGDTLPGTLLVLAPGVVLSCLLMEPQIFLQPLRPFLLLCILLISHLCFQFCPTGQYN